MNTETQSLVGRFGGLVGLPRAVFAIAVGLLLGLLLVLADFADGGSGSSGKSGLWRMALEPAVIVYILGIQPRLHGRWTLALEALRPLAARPELVEAAHAVKRRGEWLASLLGAAFAVWVTRSQPGHGRWLSVYLSVSNIVMYGLMALAIYDGLLRTRQLTRIVRAGLHLDLFDRRLLTPLARWGQSVSLTFVGGTCLSLVFQSYQSLFMLQSLVIYLTLTVVSLTLFLTSIWSIHGALVVARERELAIVRGHWSQARRLLKQKLGEGTSGEVTGLYEPIVVLGAYENQVLAASTWPFNPKIVREVLASLVAPILIYGVKIALGLAGGT